MSAQGPASDGRSWIVRPFLRIRRFAVLIVWQQGEHHTVASSIASWHPRPENPLAGEACALGDALGGQVLRDRLLTSDPGRASRYYSNVIALLKIINVMKLSSPQG